jgi:hypothetical protein
VSQLYACDEISGTKYLRADMQIVCWDENDNTYFMYAVVWNFLPLIMYTIGIPLFLGWKLYKHKQNKTLNKIEAQYELGFFYLPYLNRWYYFECLDMLHKLYFSSVVLVVPPDYQLWTGMAGGYVYMCVLLVLSPYPDSKDLGLHLVAQVEILLVLLGELVFVEIAAQDDWADTAEAATADFILSLILLTLMFSFFLLFLYHVKRKIARILCSSKQAAGLDDDLTDMQKKLPPDSYDYDPHDRLVEQEVEMVEHEEITENDFGDGRNDFGSKDDSSLGVNVI